MVVTTCNTCGRELHKPPSLVRAHNFCNSECYHLWRRTLRGPLSATWKGGPKSFACEQCGSPFQDRAASGRRYCSRLCKVEAARHARVCLHCGQEFTGRVRSFCTFACAMADRRAHPKPMSVESREKLAVAKRGTPGLSGPSNPMYKDGRASAALVECQHCGSVFEGPAYRRYCSMECKVAAQPARMRAFFESPRGLEYLRKRSLGMSGQLNSNWQHGRWVSGYAPGFLPTLKKLVRSRDGNVCRLCGVAPHTDDPLVVHHIDHAKTDHAFENLITLCRPCHGRVHHGTATVPSA